MYQDVLLDNTETDSDDGLLNEEQIEIKSKETELKMNANRPFMFMIRMDHELLGLGRVTVDNQSYKP